MIFPLIFANCTSMSSSQIKAECLQTSQRTAEKNKNLKTNKPDCNHLFCINTKMGVVSKKKKSREIFLRGNIQF